MQCALRAPGEVSVRNRVDSAGHHPIHVGSCHWRTAAFSGTHSSRPLFSPPIIEQLMRLLWKKKRECTSGAVIVAKVFQSAPCGLREHVRRLRLPPCEMERSTYRGCAVV